MPWPSCSYSRTRGPSSNNWEQSFSGRLLISFFASVTPRTAGFNSIDYTQVTTATLFLTLILMGIGGSPGSTAGGIKTTTLAVLFARINRLS